MLIVGAAGLTLVALAALEKSGLELNGALLTILLEMSKAGMILWILKKAAEVFL